MRYRFPAALLLSLLLVLPAAADDDRRIVIVPPGPTSLTPVEVKLFLLCQSGDPTVERTGSVIRIHVAPRPEICDPPVPAEHTIPIGTLPVGEYRVDVVDELDVVYSRTFVVRNGGRTAIEVHPFAVLGPALDRTRIRLHANDGLPFCVTTCDDVTIVVGDTTVPKADIEPSGDVLFFRAPQLDEGLYDVVVTTSLRTVTLPGALYFFDMVDDPDSSVFERVLFPILLDARGAHGSHWVSEAAIANSAPWYIDNFNYVEPFVCLGFPCLERKSPGQFISFNGDHYPRGVALLTPRAEASNLAFTLRVRDTAFEAEGFGTDVPVVREQDMFTNTDLTLLDVPIDPRYRTKVRLYLFDSVEHDTLITVIRPNEASLSERRKTYTVRVSRDCNVPTHCASIPWYAEFDLPAGRVDERANVYVGTRDRDTPAWAFASVTNNATQQVTIVTADGSGGEPACDPCLP